ncbi:MAG: S8 family serine peptidase [Acidobacteriia bacterium]|nr:S8 family serine peptidase [Terriglobia bacterium]
MPSGAILGKTLRRTAPFFLCAFPVVAQFAPNRYTVILQDPPVAARLAAREELESPAAASYRTQIEEQQKRISTELASRDIQITGSVSTLLNAIFVTATPDRIPQILAIPGVLAVRPMRRFKPLLNKAVGLMNAPTAWNAVGGQTNAGAGIKIGILDTGIDQTHPAFQDSSLKVPSGFPKCTTGHSEDCAFTNNKVIVARSYVRQIAVAGVTDPNNPAAQSQPDDYSPRDRNGHGTAVASSAAANQNTGPAMSTTGTGITFTGMAPKAYLGNYKIYGSPGVNDTFTDDILIKALDDAFSDGMDVVSLSSGGPALTGATENGAACGMPAGTPCDPAAYAFETAAQKGLLITVAAGNSGSDAIDFYNENYPYFNSISSPADAPSVIGVGATLNSHALTLTVSANASSAPANVKNIPAQVTDASFLPASSGANAAPLIDVSQLGNDGHACSALPANSLNGAFALIQRGSTCTLTAKAAIAQDAGAIGVIFYMADSTPPSIVTGFSFNGPIVIIALSDGVNLKNYIDANPGQVVTIDMAGLEIDLSTYNTKQQISPPIAANQLAAYSSFGPSTDGLIKPDLVATGGLDYDAAPSAGLYMAAQNYDPNGDFYSVNRYAAGNGTSFATPITAGAAALIKQAHPQFTAAQVKSALVNFSAQDTTQDDFGDTVDVEYLGAGRLDAGAAINATVAVAPSTISFGYLKSGTPLPITQTLTVTNQGTATVALSVIVANQQTSGAAVGVNQSTFSIPAGGSASLKVTLSGAVPVPGEYTGQITLNSSGTPALSLHIPYMFLVGDGVPYNVIPGQDTPCSFVGGEGTPGQDVGVNVVQVIDQYGVPVSGAAVTLTAPQNSVTFNSCTSGNCGLVAPACSGSGTNSVTCNTDSHGWAYTDLVLGPNTGTPSITVDAGGISLVCSATILPKPALTAGGIQDNAAFQPVIAPGSIVAVKGVNLMDSAELMNTTKGYDVSTTSPYPIVLDGVNVSFDVPSAGISVPATIVAVSPNQINIQAPWELAGQTSAQVKVIIDQLIYSSVQTATVASYTPAFFTNSGNVADALDTKYHVISTSNAAVRGQVIQLFANGLGPVNNQPADGFPASGSNSTTTTACTVNIGGQSVSAQFCGLAPGLAIYQVNVQVPANISPGSQPVTISVGGKTSPSGVVIPVQ